jgi:hypothetical protein
MRRPLILGAAGVFFATLGLLCWIGYGAFATKSINAVISHESTRAGQLASYADACTMTQLVLGALAVGAGLRPSVYAAESRLVRRLGLSAVCCGLVVLALSMILV